MEYLMFIVVIAQLVYIVYRERENLKERESIHLYYRSKDVQEYATTKRTITERVPVSSDNTQEEEENNDYVDVFDMSYDDLRDNKIELDQINLDK